MLTLNPASAWLSIGPEHIDLSAKPIQSALEELSTLEFVSYPIKSKPTIEKHVNKLLNTDNADDIIVLVEFGGNLISIVQFKLCSRDLEIFYASLFDHDQKSIVHIAGYWED